MPTFVTCIRQQYTKERPFHKAWFKVIEISRTVLCVAVTMLRVIYSCVRILPTSMSVPIFGRLYHIWVMIGYPMQYSCWPAAMLASHLWCHHNFKITNALAYRQRKLPQVFSEKCSQGALSEYLLHKILKYIQRLLISILLLVHG